MLATSGPVRRPRRRRLRLLSAWRLLALLLVYGASLAGAGGYYVITTVMSDLPDDLGSLLDYQPSRKSTVLSSDGEEVGAFSIENRKVFALDRLPAHVVAAFLSAEDHRFWEHGGFDLVGIARAAIANFRSDAVSQGGSTITQQIIKQTLLADAEKVDTSGMTDDEARELRLILKYQRKMKEVILAVRIERELTKAEILSIYLNHVYLGHGAYGVAAAAEAYFGKDVESLTVAEAALLAGLVAAPGQYAPHLDFGAARTRQRYVLGRMRADNFIGDGELATALAEPIAIVDAGELNHLAAPYFVESVRQQATRVHGQTSLFRGGLRFYATVDTGMQAAAEAALRRGLEAVDRRLGFRGPIGRVPEAERAALRAGPPHTFRAGAAPLDTASERLEPDDTYVAMVVEAGRGVTVDLGPEEVALSAADVEWIGRWQTDGKKLAVGDLLPVRYLAPATEGGPGGVALAQPPELQGALVAMDLSGRVVAMVGGYDWSASQFNRVVQARRQIGSAIKPFIYGAALASGRTEVDRLYDGPVYVPTASGTWSPSNYDEKFTGWTTLRSAIARSLNTISVQLLVDVGLDRVLEVMRGFGITSPIPRHVSISLGTPDLTLLEVTAGYAGIAAGGRQVTPRLWDLVTTTSGDTVEDLRGRGPGPQVLTPDVAYVLTDMMRGVVTEGTAKAAQALGRPAAGKTGTSANFKDVWFVGFTADLVCGVWIGRDNSLPIGDKITGGGAAVPIWLEFMQRAHPATPVRDFPVPPGVTFARSDRWSGDPAGPGADAVWVPFARGTMPAGYAPRAAPSFDALVPAPPAP